MMDTFKRTLSVVAVVVAILLSAAAREKKPLVYDRTGEISYAPIHYDSEAHITTKFGDADAYCDSAGSSITCTDSPGGLSITLEDGKDAVPTKYVIFNQQEQISDECLLHATMPNICDPLYRLIRQVFKIRHENTLAELTAEKAAVENLPCGATKSCTAEDFNSATTKAKAEFKKRIASVKFLYRLATASGLSLYCIPHELTDRKGKVQQREACYLK